jgi:hypothetical protein
MFPELIPEHIGDPPIPVLITVTAIALRALPGGQHGRFLLVVILPSTLFPVAAGMLFLILPGGARNPGGSALGCRREDAPLAGRGGKADGVMSLTSGRMNQNIATKSGASPPWKSENLRR